MKIPTAPQKNAAQKAREESQLEAAAKAESSDASGTTAKTIHIDAATGRPVTGVP